MSGLKEKATVVSIAILIRDIDAGPHTIHSEVSITEESSKILGKSFGLCVLLWKKTIKHVLFLLFILFWSTNFFFLISLAVGLIYSICAL